MCISKHNINDIKSAGVEPVFDDAFLVRYENTIFSFAFLWNYAPYMWKCTQYIQISQDISHHGFRKGNITIFFVPENLP